MYLGKLGLDPFAIASGVLSLATKPGNAPPASGGGGTGGGNISVATATTVQTAINPQISPVFIQQEKPQDSAVQAATAQVAPSPQSAGTSQMEPPTATGIPAGAPRTGAIPGIDSASGYMPTGTPLALPQPMAQAGISPVVAFAAAGILLFAVVMKGRKGKKSSGGTRRRRRSKPATTTVNVKAK